MPLLERIPDLKVVLEHITTKQAVLVFLVCHWGIIFVQVEFVSNSPPNIAATVTPQHMTMNRNELFKVKRPSDDQASICSSREG